MADKLYFSLVSPERELIGEEVEMIVLPGIEGDLGVLPGHMDLMSVLRAGTITIFADNKPIKRFFVESGFVEVSAKRCLVLANNAEDIAQLSQADVGDGNDDVAIARRQAIAQPAYANL